MKDKWIVTLMNGKKYETFGLRTADGCMELFNEKKTKFEKVEKHFFYDKKIPMVQTERIYTHVFPLHQVKSAILEEGE